MLDLAQPGSMVNDTSPQHQQLEGVGGLSRDGGESKLCSASLELVTGNVL